MSKYIYTEATVGSKTITGSGIYRAEEDGLVGYSVVTISLQTEVPVMQSVSVTPTFSEQTIVPDDGYTAFSVVTVNPIPSAFVNVESVTASAADVVYGIRFATKNGFMQTGTMPVYDVTRQMEYGDIVTLHEGKNFGTITGPDKSNFISSISITHPGIYEAKSGTGFESVIVSVASEQEVGGYFDGTISAYFADTMSLIGEGAFMGRECLQKVSTPNVKFISRYAFSGCVALSEVYAPAVIRIGSSAFQDCSSLSSITLTSAKDIGSYAFKSCSSLQELNFPNAVNIGSEAFNGCLSVIQISMPNVTEIGLSAFYDCVSLSSISFPKISMIYSCTFANCSSLSDVYLPQVIELDTEAFSGCDTLSLILFLNLSWIGPSAFFNCRSLMSLYLLSTSIVYIYYRKDIFNNTPIVNSTYTGSYGSIFVRESLVSVFKSRSDWSNFAARIVGLTDEEIASLTV